MEATLTPTSDHSIEVSQGIGDTPKKPRYWLTSPNWVSRSQTQTSPMTVARDHRGGEEQGPGEGVERIALVDEEGREQPDDGDPGDDDEAVEEDVPERGPRPLVAERLAEVVEADPVRRPDDAPLGERDVRPEEDGHDVEDEERDGEEGDEEVADPVHLAAGRRAADEHRGRVHAAWPGAPATAHHENAPRDRDGTAGGAAPGTGGTGSESTDFIRILDERQATAGFEPRPRNLSRLPRP